MCSIKHIHLLSSLDDFDDKGSICINDYCTCKYKLETNQRWLSLNWTQRSKLNQFIGYFINLYRKPRDLDANDNPKDSKKIK